MWALFDYENGGGKKNQCQKHCLTCSNKSSKDKILGMSPQTLMRVPSSMKIIWGVGIKFSLGLPPHETT